MKIKKKERKGEGGEGKNVRKKQERKGKKRTRNQRGGRRVGESMDKGKAGIGRKAK